MESPYKTEHTKTASPQIALSKAKTETFSPGARGPAADNEDKEQQ